MTNDEPAFDWLLDIIGYEVDSPVEEDRAVRICAQRSGSCPMQGEEVGPITNGAAEAGVYLKGGCDDKRNQGPV